MAMTNRRTAVMYLALLAICQSVACGNRTAPGTAPAKASILLIDDAVAAGLVKPGQPWTTDFSWSGSRHVGRVLVPFSRIYYWVDRTEQAGVAYEFMRAFGAELYAQTPWWSGTPTIVMIPTRHERLMADLASGAGDIAYGGITVTTMRGEQVAFSQPTNTGIRDIIVTGPTAKAIATMDDLSGLSIVLRHSSGEFAALELLNQRLVQASRAPARIILADDLLEDEDLLQMVDAGIFPATVVKDYVAMMLAQVYERLKVRTDLVVQDHVTTAIAIRKSAPLLQSLVDAFVVGHGAVSTNYGDALLAKHFGTAERLRNPTSDEELQKFREASTRLRQYGATYDLDWLLVSARAYEDTRLNALTDVQETVKEMRSIIDQYYRNEPMDMLNKALFSLAAHDAGPTVIADLRARTKAAGLDPNLWFYNVEVIAAHRLGRKTVDYVGNIYKYYVAYKAMGMSAEI